VNLPDINALRDDMLVELANRSANNGNPISVVELCAKLRSDIDWKANNELARSAGWLLVHHSPPLAKRVVDSDRPNALLLALTALGKSEASRLHLAQQPLGFTDKLASDKVQKISTLFLSSLSLAVSIAAFVVAYLAFQKS
jgi:hypothetical protein